MKKLNEDDIRDSQLKMLEYIDEYCSKNGLRYYLAGGTLLGAIRHKGYIPWDDDIDIMMPRPDYERLLSQRKQISNSMLQLISPYDNNVYPYPYSYAKMFDMNTFLVEMPDTKRIKSHIYIDIFPLDGLPKDQKESNRWFKQFHRLIMLRRFFSIASYNANYGSNIHKFFWKIVSMVSTPKLVNKCQSFLDNKASKYSFDTSDFVADVVAGYGVKERNRRDVFCVDRALFEGKELCIPKGYHEYLSNMYGDYMKLPPEKDRKRSHDYIATSLIGKD